MISLFIFLAVASPIAVLAATDLVQFQRCPDVSIKVERSGALASLMVIDQDHQAWSATQATLEPSGRRLDWLLLNEDSSVVLTYQEFVSLPHQGSYSSMEFGNLQLPNGEWKALPGQRMQMVALRTRPKLDGSGTEAMALGEVLSLVEGCVIDVSILLPGASQQDAERLLQDLRFSPRAVKHAPTP
ncbi:MAG: hypothetical protein ACTHLT_07155 [Devosia sp.]